MLIWELSVNLSYIYDRNIQITIKREFLTQTILQIGSLQANSRQSKLINFPRF
jgi:hypothetical protein